MRTETLKQQNMKNKLFTIAGVAVAMAVTSVQATQITGSVDMSGTAILNNTLLGSATAANSFTGVSVGGIPTGSYVGTAGNSVTWNAFSWPSAVSVSPLWSFTDAGTGYTYSFTLSSVHAAGQDNTFLNLLGTGTLSITGVGSPYEDTTGSWSFTISNPTGTSHQNFAFTFANSQTAAVPDGGTTVMLLGAGLSCLGLIRRKLVA
ncbi:MAG TPA: VPDSG-CTERM sorting domain-containing protein [Verrucomicrobiae bacterium]